METKLTYLEDEDEDYIILYSKDKYIGEFEICNDTECLRKYIYLSFNGTMHKRNIIYLDTMNDLENEFTPYPTMLPYHKTLIKNIIDDYELTCNNPMKLYIIWGRNRDFIQEYNGRFEFFINKHNLS